MASSKSLIVAAIDFGTTYSGWAFSFKHEYESDPTKIFTNIWSASQLSSYKAPTCILIKPDGRTIEKFGYEAEDQYSDLCANEQEKDWYYFRRFKMLLWGAGNISSDITKDTKIKDVSGKELPALLVFSLSIRFMKDRMLDTSNKQLGSEKLQENDFHWVLTVPAIWNDKAKQFMRLAAEQSGIPGERLTIALEPEAASLYCKHLKVDKETLKENTMSAFREGKTYMVLDAGGGTIDITIHEVCHGGGLKEVDKASGGAWGGTTVDEAFIKFLEAIVGEEVMKSFKEKLIEDYLELLRDFESKKRNVDADTDALVTLRVPLQLCDLVQDMKSTSFRNLMKASSYSEQVELRGDKMRIKASLFRSFFEASVTNIVDHVHVLLQKPQNSAVEAILMVGGYSESPLLQQIIKRKFEKLTIITPGDAGLAVLKGAVIFGHEPILIKERVAKYTYGTDVRGNAWLYLLSKGTMREFSKLVTNGQKLVVGEPQQEQTYVPVHENQSALSMNIYVTRDTDPRFITDVGVEKIADFSIPLSGSGLEREVTVKIIFGGTEMKVVCIEKKTGTETHLRVDFLQ